ncbi:MAG TPA: aromatic ring-hydroxylating dioxygenase subunit alpha [Thermohalobaculum sp.]|nr:aromatic ring-hydroxylating dioxygenase subunit alpha [Thermohalobaculum sp.]
MRNLDPDLYTDPATYARECEEIFWSHWQMLGPAARLDAPGAYLATEMAGAKVFAIRGGDGVLRAFRNVCRHRGARLLDEGEGECAMIRCPYHNWVYGLDGSLLRTPWFGKEPGFDMTDWPLTPISVETWRGLVFVAINPIEPLAAQLGATIPQLAGEPIETFHMVAERRLVFDANWKTYTDNFVEGYHIPGIHPAFFQAIDFEHFETTAHDNLVRMTAPPREGLFYRGKWLWMWPNWTLSLFDGGMNASRINPLGPDRTELIYHFYFADTSEAARPAREDTIARNIAVLEEDFEICVETQKNYASGGYAPGPLSPRHEQGVAWFQNRVRAALGGATD